MNPRHLLASCFAFLVSLPAVAGVQSITQTGAAYDGGESVSINVTSFSAPGYPNQIAGNIYISGFSAPNAGVNIGAPVLSVTVTGASYKRAVITSKPFFFIDLATRAKTLAKMMVVVDNAPPRGHFLYQIVSQQPGNGFGTSIAVTATPDGQLSAVPLTSGSTVFRGY